MKVAVAVVLIFAARFALAAWFDPGRDGDLPWQHWLGMQILQSHHIPLALGSEAFAAPGAPWVPQEWALSLLVALTLNTPRFILLVMLTATAGAATLLLTAWSARRLGASTAATALCVLCVAFSMVESYGIRAQVFAWAMLAALMFLLRTAHGPSRWWMVAVTALWANLHASALLAPALLALWTIGIALEERGWTANVRSFALLTVACAVAVFLTPLGYRLPLYAVSLVHSPIRFAIQEWQPSYLSATSFALGPLGLIAATCLFGVRRTCRVAEFLLFAALTWMAFSALRNVPVCAIVLAPAVAQRLTVYLPERLRINAIFNELPAQVVLYVITLFMSAFSGLALAHSPDFTGSRVPARAIAALARVAGTHQLLCEDFAWCSSALPYRNLREFIDGRCDPFPLTVWNDYETVVSTKRGWKHVIKVRDIDAIVANSSSKLGRALPHLRAWHELYSDKTYKLYIRDS
jgi:hypothetical protein